MNSFKIVFVLSPNTKVFGLMPDKHEVKGLQVIRLKMTDVPRKDEVIGLAGDLFRVISVEWVAPEDDAYKYHPLLKVVPVLEV